MEAEYKPQNGHQESFTSNCQYILTFVSHMGFHQTLLNINESKRRLYNYIFVHLFITSICIHICLNLYFVQYCYSILSCKFIYHGNDKLRTANPVYIFLFFFYLSIQYKIRLLVPLQFKSAQPLGSIQKMRCTTTRFGVEPVEQNEQIQLQCTSLLIYALIYCSYLVNQGPARQTKPLSMKANGRVNT